MTRMVKQRELRRHTAPPTGEGSGISARARARGYHSVDALKREMLRQRPVWWQGRHYHCPLCDLDFIDARSAAAHVVLQQHPVLRMDAD